MKRLKILIVDDEPLVRETIRDALREDGSWNIEMRGFDDLEESLRWIRPDMVVLDLVDGDRQDDNIRGNSSYEVIWEHWFCPIVVYSGFPDAQSFEPHPFVARVTKGSGTEEKVKSHLRRFMAQGEMIRSVQNDFDTRVREALRDSVDAIRHQPGATRSESRSDAVVQRAVRRLVAARADAVSSEDDRLYSWERLVVPPLGNQLLTADLLKRREAEWTDEAAFRLVLTPSCDLVRAGKRTAKVEQILVACCEPVGTLGSIELPRGKELSKSNRRKLRSALSEGMIGEHLVLPRFRNHVPLMIANLKRLELLRWSQVDSSLQGEGDGGGQEEFERVASTDSPFREMVVWAYLLVTGRPGLPDLELEAWLDDISDHLGKAEQ